MRGRVSSLVFKPTRSLLGYRGVKDEDIVLAKASCCHTSLHKMLSISTSFSLLFSTSS